MALIDTVVLSIVFLTCFGAVTWRVLQMIIFKHKVILYDPTATQTKYLELSARDYIDEDGSLWWKLSKKLGNVSQVPRAPSECISVGKILGLFKHDTATGYLMDDGVYWATHPSIKALPSKFDSIIDVVTNWEIKNKVPKSDSILTKKEEIKKIEDFNSREKEYNLWKEQVIDKWKEIKGVDFVFYPLDSSQRVVYINNYKKAEEKKNKNWQDVIMPLGFGILCFLMVVCFLIFIGDAVKPVMDAKAINLAIVDSMNKWEEKQSYNLELLQQLKNDIQVIKDERVVSRTNEAPN